MTSDDLLHLLTAAVDGELTPAEAARFDRLLAESADARTRYARLKADRRRLQALPRALAPDGLRQRVLANLPATTPRPPRGLPRRSVAALGLAASVAAAVSVSVWLAARKPTTADVVARPPAPKPFTRPPLPKADRPVPALALAPAPRPAAEVAVRSEPPTPLDIPPRLVEREVNAFPPVLTAQPLDLVRVRVPFLARLADLDREDVRQTLADELGRAGAFRVDLFTKDVGRGVELLQAAAREAGVTVQTDAGAVDRLKRRQATAYVLYTEALTTAEVGGLLARLAAGDAAAPARAFETVHLAPAGPAESKDGKDLFGVDPLPGRKAAGPGADGDPQPLSAGTADQVTRQLAGKGADKPGVLLTYHPVTLRTPPTQSREAKQFLDARGPRKPGSVPVLVVVRLTGG